MTDTCPLPTKGRRRAPYRSLQDLEKTLQRETTRLQEKEGDEGSISAYSPCIIFDGVPARTIDQLQKKRIFPTPTRVLFYDKAEKMICVAMPTPRHDNAVRLATKMVDEAFTRAGAQGVLAPLGGTTAPFGNAESAKDKGKTPDACWALPPALWQGKNLAGWPQVVVEISYGDSDAEMDSDAQFWMGASRCAVRMCVVGKVSRCQVRFAVWVPGFEAGTMIKRGEIMGRRRRTGEEFCMVKGKEKVVVPFEVVFMRPRGEGEADIELLGEDFIATGTHRAGTAPPLQPQRELEPGEHVRRCKYGPEDA